MYFIAARTCHSNQQHLISIAVWAFVSGSSCHSEVKTTKCWNFHPRNWKHEVEFKASAYQPNDWPSGLFVIHWAKSVWYVPYHVPIVCACICVYVCGFSQIQTALVHVKQSTLTGFLASTSRRRTRHISYLELQHVQVFMRARNERKPDINVEHTHTDSSLYLHGWLLLQVLRICLYTEMIS